MKPKSGATEITRDHDESGLTREDMTFEDLEILHKVFTSTLFPIKIEKIDELCSSDK